MRMITSGSSEFISESESKTSTVSTNLILQPLPVHFCHSFISLQYLLFSQEGGEPLRGEVLRVIGTEVVEGGDKMIHQPDIKSTSLE